LATGATSEPFKTESDVNRKIVKKLVLNYVLYFSIRMGCRWATTAFIVDDMNSSQFAKTTNNKNTRTNLLLKYWHKQ